MQCPRCQHESPAGTKFCGQCAAPLTSVCAGCGTANPLENKFCGQCAAPLPTSTARHFVSPESYTPRHLAEKILMSKSALEGERKQVTVLFADLKGSLELLADRDPEEARELLDPVLERMIEAVHRYEGTVNQVMGDGIMALFGAPLAHEDHAVRACYAALAIQSSIRRYAEDAGRSHDIEVQIRVGLNSGEVVVRAIGSDLRIDYSAVGQTTHLAARMEQLASPQSVLLTADTCRLAEGFVRVVSAGRVPIKGLADPIEVFELIGITPTRTRIQAAAARGLTRFTGRHTELVGLGQALTRAGAGHGEVVAILGEAGVGKSRLVWEFSHSSRTQGWLVLESGSVSHGKATPYRPLIDLLRSYFQIEDSDPPGKIRDKVTGKVLGLDPFLLPLVDGFFMLLDVPVEAPEWRALDPAQRRLRTLDAVRRLVLRESQVQPLVVVFEDLQWIDAETKAFLDALIESLPAARILLIVSYRPEYHHAWGNKSYYRQFGLDALPPDQVAELLDALLGSDGSLEPVKATLAARTEGNPFFLEESVRSLIETQAFVGERGAYRLAHAFQGTQVPPTVQAVLAARIDRLPPDGKELLQAASVIGKDVPHAVLRALRVLPEDMLRRELEFLQAAEFLYESQLFPDLVYTFKHALTHEVTYASLVHDRRRALHGEVVRGMETLYSSRPAEHVERLAHHALRGEVWDKAFRYLREAGVRAVDRSANRVAVEYFEQALGVLKHLDNSPEIIEHAIDVRVDLRGPLTALGDLERLFVYVGEAKELAEVAGDRRRLGRVLGYLTQLFIVIGDHDRAMQAGQRALEIAGTEGQLDVSVVANNCLGDTHYSLGDYRRAIEFHGRNMEALTGGLLRQRFGLAGLPAVFSRAWVACALAELGRFAEGAGYAEEALRIADDARHPYSQIFADVGLGGLYLRKGEFDSAVPRLEHGAGLCQSTGALILLPYLTSMLGAAYAASRRLGEALPLLERAVDVSTSMRIMAGRAVLGSFLSEGYLLAGRRDQATRLASQALDAARRQKERGWEAWALRLCGEISAAGEEATTAERFYLESRALATELGMRPVVAHCHLGLGRLYGRTGQREQAHEHLGTAATLYHDMDMRFWLAQATQLVEAT
jgi:class 3 adenylate cyclase/tetratricopeptide (TPR) repeat protein